MMREEQRQQLFLECYSSVGANTSLLVGSPVDVCVCFWDSFGARKSRRRAGEERAPQKSENFE